MNKKLRNISNEIKNGNLRYLSRAITLIESSSKEKFQYGQLILNELFKTKQNNSIRIGISGPPGVGKSTFIESFGLSLCNQGKKVAVLAVDPSSKISKGSILGDKTRMNDLSKHPNSFIRPSPSSGVLGGVTARTRESILLCESAGFDYIFVETVGVGQSELEVSSMTDLFILLLLPGGGDELQGIKKGILEIADIIFINKSDLSEKNSNETLLDYKKAIRILSYDKDFWNQKINKISALKLNNENVIENLIDSYINKSKQSGYFQLNRTKQLINWMHQMIKFELVNEFYSNSENITKLKLLENKVVEGSISPSKAVMELLIK